jgi:DSF synthase
MKAGTQIIDLSGNRIELPRLSQDVQEGARIAAPARPRTPFQQAPQNFAQMVERQHFDELEVEYDVNEKVVWNYFNYAGRPCFTPALLRDISHSQRLVSDGFAQLGAEQPPVRYVVWASRARGIWSLGGDLDLFTSLIRRRDRDTLMRYAQSVVQEGYDNATNLGLPVITVSLIQGDALGGGFEAALSSNLIIAERSAKFGLPEILFNLFPGMGAYTFLARRITPAAAERMIMSGRIYTATELHDMGIVDILCEDGRGIEAFYDFVGRNGRRHGAHRAIFQARHYVNPVNHQEMMDIAKLWVDTALTLEELDLRKMAHLVAAQDRRRKAMP